MLFRRPLRVLLAALLLAPLTAALPARAQTVPPSYDPPGIDYDVTSIANNTVSFSSPISVFNFPAQTIQDDGFDYWLPTLGNFQQRTGATADGSVQFTYADTSANETLSFQFVNGGTSGSGSDTVPKSPVPNPVELIHFRLDGWNNIPTTSPDYVNPFYKVFSINETAFEAAGGKIYAAVLPYQWDFFTNQTDFGFSTPTNPIGPDDPLDFYLVADMPKGVHAYDSTFTTYQNQMFVGPNAMITPQGATLTPESGSGWLLLVGLLPLGLRRAFRKKSSGVLSLGVL